MQALLDETLNPLIEETIAGKDDQAAIEALLNLRIIDPACGSGHFLLAAARRLASRIARLSSPGTPSQADYRHWLREVARRTLFGVDKNPMAIELAKVALWIETVEPGKPLSFLDAHLRCGDSLLGVYDLKALEIGIPDDAYKPLTGDDKAAAAAWKKLNKQARERDDKTSDLFGVQTDDIAKAAQTIEAQDEDDLAAVKAKQAAYAKLLEGHSYWRVKTACDLYVAAFLMPKVEKPDPTAGISGITVPTTGAVRAKLVGKLEVPNLEAIAVHVARAAGAFHWPLEFPQVFLAGAGDSQGFDLALGNPPWEVNQLGEEEYFAVKAPEISQLKGKARKDAISALETADPALWSAYQNSKRLYDASNDFFRASGRFNKTAVGKINTYSLFCDLFSTAALRAGIIIPTGIATDSSTSDFFSDLINQQRLQSLYSFSEVRRVFTATDDRNPFCLLSIAQAIPKASFCFSIDSATEIKDQHRRFSLSRDQIASINPNTKTAPVFRSQADAQLTSQIYANVPVLIDRSKGESGNQWGIEFRQGLFNMTSESGLFRTARQLIDAGYVRDGCDWVAQSGDSRYIPLYEAKLIHHYDHRWATYIDDCGKDITRDVNLTEKSNPDFEIAPRYWVPQREVTNRLDAKGWSRGWLMGCRGISGGKSNTRSLIAASWPLSGVGNSQHVWFTSKDLNATACAALLAMASSLVVDFVARQKVGGANLNFFYVEQFPILPPTSFTPNDLRFISARVTELAYTTHAMKPFAEDIGYSGNAPFVWNEERRALLRAELDAKIAKLYGLTRDQLRYILDPAEVYGADYPSETFRVLKNNEIAKYGEYRTAKLVLGAWDRLDRGELT